MGRVFHPFHLLSLTEAHTQHPIEVGLPRPRADPFAFPGALAAVGDEAFVVLDVCVELFHLFQELSSRAITAIDYRGIEICLDRLYPLLVVLMNSARVVKCGWLSAEIAMNSTFCWQTAAMERPLTILWL